jgi:phage shock protein PspC (stress-responsive transcriptional regulator)
MTETTTHPPYATHRIERPRDTALAGVCTAMARITGTDPVLWRVLAVVLTFFGGIGLALYLAGMVFIPREDEQRSLGDRLIHGPDRHLTGRQLLVLTLLVIACGAFFKDSNGILTAAVLGGLVVLWLRGRTEHQPPPASPGHGEATSAGYGEATSAGYGEAAAAVPPTADLAPPVWTPPPPRPRSPFVGLTLSVALLVAGVLLLVGASGGASVPLEVVLAGALATVGLGLVVGSFFGRSPGLVAIAVLLTLGLGATVAVRPAIDAGVGDRTWVPTSAGSYHLGVGEGTLDLRSFAAVGDGTAIRARVDVGHLLVLLPDNLRTSIHARAGIGDVQVLGTDYDGRGVDKHLEVGPAGTRQLTLDLSVRTGMVEVRRG